MSRIHRRSEAGYVLVTALVALAVMSILAAAAISQATAALRLSAQAVRSEQALYMGNAGVEQILAMTRSASFIELNTPYTYNREVEPGVTGSYEAVVTVPRPGIIHIRSTGTVTHAGESTRRVVEAEIPFVQNSGDGGGGGSSPVLAFGNGSLSLMNQADICGDLYAAGDMTLGNTVTVWSKTTQEDPDSPCESIQGTGKAVASGTLTMGQVTEIQGGWCDATHYGPPYPCDEKPEVQTLPPPDFAALKEQATRWYVRPSDAAFCSDKPAGSCQVLSGGKLTTYGSQSYSQEIVYVDGDLEVPQQANRRLQISGSVTFVVTGRAILGGSVLCTGGSTCGVAFLAGGDITLGYRKEYWALLQTLGTLSGNQVTVHGNLIAQTYDLRNGVKLYPMAAGAWPPGVPGAPGESGTASPPPEGYSDWDQ
ncbi:MAG: hypothetical protein ACOY93_22230 [Bacillota bacterium]